MPAVYGCRQEKQGDEVMKYTICDADRATRRELADLLNKLISEKKECYQISEVSSGMQMVDDVSEYGLHEVCFIRTDMSGLNGIETMNAIRVYNQNLYCILYSGEEKYALQAWEHMADSFLLLPFDQKQLTRILERCRGYFQESDRAFLRLKLKGGWCHIRLCNIVNLESHAHKVVLNMADHSRIEAYGRLDWFEEKLRDDMRFVRIHKSIIVNGDYISRFSSAEVKMVNGNVYSVSRTMHDKANVQYEGYLKSKNVVTDILVR